MLAAFVFDGIMTEIQSQKGLQVGPREVVAAIVLDLIVIYLYSQSYPETNIEGVGVSCPSGA